MTFDQFKTICTLAEELTGIQFGMMTRSMIIDFCDEFFHDCDNEDDHFYAILADGRTADKEYETCKKSDLRTAYRIMYTWPDGTVWFFSNAAKKDEKLLEEDIESDVLPYLWEYVEEERDYNADELIDLLKKAIAEKAAA